VNEHHYQRIDKGVSRSHNEIEQEARQQARDEKGMFLTEYSPQKRAAAILEAIEGLQAGYPTPQVVAQKHSIKQSTLYSWLIADPRAQEARGMFFGERLALYLDQIEVAPNPLELARAREGYRAWADIASKRDPANYGVKQEITHVTADLGDRLRRARERVIDQAPIDNQPNTGVMSNQALPEPKDPKPSK
jgi:hypothetical protein